MHLECIHILGNHPINDVPQTDASVLWHQKKIEEGAQLMITGARGVGPGLIELCGHVDPVEPGSELLNGGYIVYADVLRPQFVLMEIILQWW